MLEFIVLGQIPGTHIQITFSGVLLCIALGLMIYEGYRHNRQHTLSAIVTLRRLLHRLKPLA